MPETFDDVFGFGEVVVGVSGFDVLFFYFLFGSAGHFCDESIFLEINGDQHHCFNVLFPLIQGFASCFAGPFAGAFVIAKGKLECPHGLSL